MAKQGFRSNGNTPYVYQETNSKSVAFGMDSADSDKWKLNSAPTENVLPSGMTANIEVDPATNGHITFRPNGTGNIQLQDADITTTGGVIQAAITTGALSASKGTDGQLLIGNSAGSPVWQNITSSGGTVAITNGASTINLEVATGTGVIKTVTGNTGGAISPTAGNINIVTANATPKFAGAASTETLDFGLTNLALGSSLPSAGGSVTHNVAVGQAALDAIQFDGENVAIGYHAMNASIDSSANVAVGSNALALYNALGGSGGFNTAVGERAGATLATGASNNTMIGARAGFNYLNSETDNVCINSMGVIGDVSTLRIGRMTGLGAQGLTKAYICGIDGVNVGSVAKVLTMASDQLGTAIITAGAGISVTPGPNTITVTSTVTSFTWNNVTGTSQSMVANNGYVANNAALVTMTLPTTAAFGTTLGVAGGNSGLAGGSWKIAQNAGQSIAYGNQTTTVGVTGSLTSTNQWDSITLLCVVADTKWTVVPGTQGNITVA